MAAEEGAETYSKEYFNRNRFLVGTLFRGGYSGYREMKNEGAWKIKIEKLGKYKPSGSVLDIGCAFGYFLHFLPEHYQKFGLDVSGYAIGQAKKEVPKAEFKKGDITKENPFKGKSFDAITMFDVIEHIPDITALLEKIHSMLKEKGIFIVMTPSPGPFHRLISSLGIGVLWNDKSHVSIKSREEWRDFFRKRFNVLEEFPLTISSHYLWPFEIYSFFVLEKK